MMAEKKAIGLCRGCEFLPLDDGDYDPDASDWNCPYCGESVVPYGKLTAAEKAVVRMWIWLRGHLSFKA